MVMKSDQRINNHITVFTCWFVLAFSMGATPVETSSPELDKFATQFAHNLTLRIRTLLYDASAIDHETFIEDNAAKKRMVARQKEIRSWFRRKGGNVRFDDCKTKIDRQNYLAFRRIMANREFLRLPYKKRLQFIATINGYLRAFSNNFATSLKTMLFANETQNNGSPRDLTGYFIVRLQHDVELRTWHFNKDQRTTMGAMYVPDTHTIYLNLNSMIQSPAEFIDAFEHELWHHLLPPSNSNRIQDNLWWEGFTEAVSEAWSNYFHDSISQDFPLKPSNTIQYPIQTAFASLYLGLDGGVTMAYLIGEVTPRDFVRHFSRRPADRQAQNFTALENLEVFSCVDPGFESPGDDMKATVNTTSDILQLKSIMAQAFICSNVVDKRRKKRIETLLGSWGWREDDHRPVSISRYLDNGQLSETELATGFIVEKQFVLDLVKAITMLNMQNIGKRGLGQTVFQELRIPNPLKDNIVKVIRQCRGIDSQKQFR